MFESQKGGLMKRSKAQGGEPRVERALKVEVHTEEYTVLGAIRSRHERLKDVLENWLHPFLPLEEAVVLHRDPSGKAIRQEVRSVMVRLEEILIAMPDEGIPPATALTLLWEEKPPPRLWGPRLAREKLFLVSHHSR